MKDELIFIRHILDNINAIEEFINNITKKEFIGDKEKQYAVIRAIELIGESAKNISSKFTKKHSEIPWKQIIGTRDKLIHHYFGIDLDTVWEIVKKDVPFLKNKIKNIMKSI